MYGKSYRTYQSIGYGYGKVVLNLPNCRVREWMLVSVPPVPDVRVFQPCRTRYQGILPRACRTYQSVGYRGYRCRAELMKVSSTDGYGCRTKLTKGSGTGGYRCFTKLAEGSNIVRLLVPVPVPDPRFFSKAVRGARVFYHGVPNLPSCQVLRVWKSYQADQSVGDG